MSIRVQCGHCGSVMNVREDYAGTERRCPKCKGKFQVPSLEEARASAEGATGDDDDFDPVAFLTGEKPAPKSGSPSAKGKGGSTPAAARPPADDFDPMDILADGPRQPAAAKPTPEKPDRSKTTAESTAPKSPAAPTEASPSPADDADFDPMDVLETKASATVPPAGDVKKPAAETTAEEKPSAPPTSQPQSPQPRRPSWAKPLPEPEKRDWEESAAEAPAEEPASEPNKPQPRRPSWAKAPPPPENEDWLEPADGDTATKADAPAAATEPPKPKRPSWARPLPGEQQEVRANDVPEDASAAAKAAASAVAGVSADNPALQEGQPRRPLFDRERFVAWLKRRMILLAKTAVAAAILFGIAWKYTGPRPPTFEVIGKNTDLTYVPVEGRLTVDDKPVAGARVMFHPRGTPFRSPEAMTDADGQFRLQFCEGYPGAPPGRYRVQLQFINKDGTDAGVTADNLLRDRTFVIPEGGGTVDVTLSTKKKSG